MSKYEEKLEKQNEELKESLEVSERKIEALKEYSSPRKYVTFDIRCLRAPFEIAHKEFDRSFIFHVGNREDFLKPKVFKYLTEKTLIEMADAYMICDCPIFPTDYCIKKVESEVKELIESFVLSKRRNGLPRRGTQFRYRNVIWKISLRIKTIRDISDHAPLTENPGLRRFFKDAKSSK